MVWWGLVWLVQSMVVWKRQYGLGWEVEGGVQWLGHSLEEMKC